MSLEDNNPLASGISLEDLPDANVDETTNLIQQRIDAFKSRKRLEKELAADPRASDLASLENNEQKLLRMTRLYEFGSKELRWKLVILYLLPILIKYSSIIPWIMFELKSPNEFNILSHLGTLIFAVFDFAEIITGALFILRFPMGTRRDFFLVGFNGLNLPRKVKLPPGEIDERLKVAWGQIAHVVFVSQRPWTYLELRNKSNELLGQMRWNLSKNDKKLLLKLLRRLIGEQHPLRQYVERELGYEE